MDGLAKNQSKQQQSKCWLIILSVPNKLKKQEKT